MKSMGQTPDRTDQKLFVFENIIIDPARYELWYAGKVVYLRPKVFDVLVYLMEHHHRVVPKRELLNKFWASQVVSDAAFFSSIKEARAALGDNGRAQRVIRTIPRRGYRFVAPFSQMPKWRSKEVTWRSST